MADYSDEEKLAAAQKLNKHWQTAAAMPPGPQRERYLQTIHRVSGAVAKAYDMPMEGEGPIDTALKYGLKGINYGAGLVQAPILAGAEAIAGPPGKAAEVLSSAIDPRKPGVSAGEVARDIGIPPGPSLSDVVPGYAEPGTPGMWPPNKGGPLDPTLRGAGSAAFDFLVSPGGYKALAGSAEKKLAGLTATDIQNIETAAREANLAGPTMGARAAGMGQFAADPLGETWGAGARKGYNSAFGAADKMATDGGAGPVSDVMYRNNAWGGPSSLSTQAKDLTARLGEGVDADIGRAHELDMFGTVPRSELVDKANSGLSKAMGVGGQTAGAKEAASRLEQEMAAAYGTEGLPDSTNEFGIQEAQDLKRSMQGKAAHQRAYVTAPANPSLSPNAADNRVEAEQLGNAYKAVGNRARRAVENLADEAEPGLGGKIYSQNSDIASLLEGQDALDKSATQSLGTSWNKNWPATAAAGVLGGSAAMGMGYHDPYALALGAVLGAAASSTAVRTGVGLLGAKSAPWGSNAIRVYLDQKYNPWLREHQPFNDSGR